MKFKKAELLGIEGDTSNRINSCCISKFFLDNLKLFPEDAFYPANVEESMKDVHWYKIKLKDTLASII